MRMMAASAFLFRQPTCLERPRTRCGGSHHPATQVDGLWCQYPQPRISLRSRAPPRASTGRLTPNQPPRTSNIDFLNRYGGGLGFAIGGQEDEGTNQVYGVNGATVNAPNMVVYNTSSQEWYNVSTRAISYYGTAQYGMAQFVPSFGPVGLLFVLGGQAVSGDTNSDPYFSFQNLSFYEPVSQTWKFQTASGQFPQEVVTPCVTGVDGDNGTYEVRRSHPRCRYREN